MILGQSWVYSGGVMMAAADTAASTGEAFNSLVEIINDKSMNPAQLMSTASNHENFSGKKGKKNTIKC